MFRGSLFLGWLVKLLVWLDFSGGFEEGVDASFRWHGGVAG